MGKRIRIKNIAPATIPGNGSPFLDAFIISEPAILYRAVFVTDSNLVRVKVEIDGVEITPSAGPGGVLLEDLGTMGLNTEGTFGVFDFTEYKANCFSWTPPEPIRCRTETILKFRSKNPSTKQLVNGFFTYRKVR
jgi:hypothetical protein